MNSYSDNMSLLSFNDYIDLDSALAEEELSSVTHTDSRHEPDNYKFSLKSINDQDLDRFRRSLITPMSTPQQRQRQLQIKRPDCVSPTPSCNGSVTESVALFNNILNDDSVDLVKSDLKDFTFNMDDVVSRPNSRLPTTTPSPPQNNSRYNRDSLVSRHSNISTNNVEMAHPPPQQRTAISRPNKSDEKRRWSSYIPSHLDITEESPIMNQSNTNQHNNSSNLPLTNRYNTKEKRDSIIDSKYSHQQMEKTRQVERRASHRSSLNINPTTLYLTNKKTNHETTTTSKMAQPTISKMAQPTTSKVSQPTISKMAQPAIETRMRDITTSNRYAERRSSYRDLTRNSSKPSTKGEDHLTFSTNCRVERRFSQEPILAPKTATTTIPQSQVTATNRRVERRSSHELELAPRITTSNRTRNRYSYHGGYGTPPGEPLQPQKTERPQQPRRSRALSVPSSSNSDQPKPSLMPVAVSRIRKYSNGSSKYATVPENEIAPPQISKGVRFSCVENNQTKQQEDVLPTASRSTGGYSNSTASSSHSGDTEHDPPTPPSSYIDRHESLKRRSIPHFPVKDIPPRINRYSNYLASLKDEYEEEEEESPPLEPVIATHRQRVYSQDKHPYVEPVTAPRRQRVYSDEEHYTEPVISRRQSINFHEESPYVPPRRQRVYSDEKYSYVEPIISRRQSVNHQVNSVVSRRQPLNPQANRYVEPVVSRRQRVNVEEENSYVEPVVSRRQRVNSDDNEYYYKGQPRTTRQQQNQNNVTESPRELLAQIQERRVKTAAILHGIYGP